MSERRVLESNVYHGTSYYSRRIVRGLAVLQFATERIWATYTFNDAVDDAFVVVSSQRRHCQRSGSDFRNENIVELCVETQDRYSIYHSIEKVLSFRAFLTFSWTEDTYLMEWYVVLIQMSFMVYLRLNFTCFPFSFRPSHLLSLSLSLPGSLPISVA